MSTPSSGPSGLRERKKEHTRAAIREAALRLFRTQGYTATTVRQIADAAGVSQQTLFRYFPSKAATVLQDPFDPALAAVFEAQPAELGATASFRAALRQIRSALTPEQIAAETERRALIAEMDGFPAIISAQIQEAMDLYAQALARRSGRAADDAAVRTWVGAMSGIAIACYLAWFADPEQSSIFDIIDESMALMEAGIPV